MIKKDPMKIKIFSYWKKLEWDSNKCIPYAAELVSAAINFQNYEIAIDAAQFILQNSAGVSNLLVDIAKSLLKTEYDPQKCELDLFIDSRIKKVRYLKRLLYQEPKNSVAWIDLARNYVVLGSNEKAQRAVEIALNLNPNNRFILRSNWH